MLKTLKTVAYYVGYPFMYLFGVGDYLLSLILGYNNGLTLGFMINYNQQAWARLCDKL